MPAGVCRFQFSYYNISPLHFSRRYLSCFKGGGAENRHGYRYSEAIDILYSRNIFRLEHLDTLAHFSTITLPSRFNSIRSLHLYWYFYKDIFTDAYLTYPPRDLETWQKTCDILASMEGLRDLTITLAARRWDQASRVKLLHSMMRIKPKGSFEVTVPWAWPGLEEVEEEKLEGMPFRITHML